MPPARGGERRVFRASACRDWCAAFDQAPGRAAASVVGGRGAGEGRGGQKAVRRPAKRQGDPDACAGGCQSASPVVSGSAGRPPRRVEGAMKGSAGALLALPKADKPRSAYAPTAQVGPRPRRTQHACPQALRTIGQPAGRGRYPQDGARSCCAAVGSAGVGVDSMRLGAYNICA
jgi:hypothetical protein